jgi:hypothetical protein
VPRLREGRLHRTDIEVDTWTITGPENRSESYVVVQGHPHRELEEATTTTTLEPLVPDDVSGDDLDLE